MSSVAKAIVSVGFTPNGTHIEPQRASVRAGRLAIACESSPHDSVDYYASSTSFY